MPSNPIETPLRDILHHIDLAVQFVADAASSRVASAHPAEPNAAIAKRPDDAVPHGRFEPKACAHDKQRELDGGGAVNRELRAISRRLPA
jgi:hypothetical protein